MSQTTLSFIILVRVESVLTCIYIIEAETDPWFYIVLFALGVLLKKIINDGFQNKMRYIPSL